MSEFADFDDYQDSAAADQDLHDRHHTDDDGFLDDLAQLLRFRPVRRAPRAEQAADEEAARSLRRAGRPVTRPDNPWE